jgi:Asp-tRNA(Asn)/Glu-tRNA(Gln) amidotransferase B subunit
MDPQLCLFLDYEKIAKEVCDQHPKQVEAYKMGKGGTLGFFVEQIIKTYKGAINPNLVSEALRKELDSR